MSGASGSPAPDGDLVLMARIGAAHGIRGEVRVKPFGDDPLSFTDYGSLQTADGRKFKVTNARVQKTVVVTKFKGVNDRNAAEALNGVELYIPRERLPEPEEDEFYHTDLIGLSAVDPKGTKLGTIITVQDFGAGDLLEIRPPADRSFYVSFTREFVPAVDLEAGLVTVDLPDDYLRTTDKPDDGLDDPD